MTKFVALYCRLSPRPDGSYEGVDLQEKWGRDYAARAWPGIPVEVFADKGISAANGDERPDYERFRKWIADGKIVHVWAVEQTRLERREVEWFQLAAELDAAGISELHTNRDGIVRVRDEVAGIKAVLAAGEVRKMKRRINDRLDEIAAEGRPSGTKPFGYRHAVVDGVKTYEQIPEQAAALRWAADKVLAGWSLASIARELRGRGLVGAHGGRITPQSVRSALTSPTVAGKRVHRGEVKGSGIWSAILDEQTWQGVVAELGSARTVKRSDGGEHRVTAKSRTNRAGRKYVLTGGVAVCVCGAPLAGTVQQFRSGGRMVAKPYLVCRKERGGCGRLGIMLGETEKHVATKLFDELDKPEFLDQLSADDHEARRDELVNALASLENVKRPELARMWARGLTTTEWEAARDALDETEQELRAELAAVPRPIRRVDIAGAREAWPDMTLDEQRAFLRMFIERVTIRRAKPGTKKFDPDRVDIDWRELHQ